ncbi:MAG: ABC transporter ATP-binding protein [Desulfobacteraceae bacterium]|nr:ABC transporter ATP-binding protein [Desulfobacteraceae bacterium]
MDQRRGTLLDVTDLRVIFHTYRGTIKALNGVQLWLNHGERLGIVGESGCGKSVTSLALMQLIEQPGEMIGGRIFFDGHILNELDESQLDGIRGKDMATIFQEPVAALNPVMRVGYQIAENIIQKSGNAGSRKINEDVGKMLSTVGLDPNRTMRLYPHQLSGGMAQRVMIAMALSARPKLLIADEPTSALDVTIQAQILELLDDLVREFDYSTILITHDMGVAASFCDKVAVMYAGNTVEYATTTEIFHNPLHPYARGLFRAVPRMGNSDELETIPGVVPDLVNPPPGCRFHPRCRHAMPECKASFPPFLEIEPGHFVACYCFVNKG